MTQENFGVFDTLVVVSGPKVHFVSDLLHFPQQATRFFDIAGGILLQAELSHLVDELSIEEALLAGLSLVNPLLQGGDGILIEWLIVGRGRKRGNRERGEDNEHRWQNVRSHKEPPLERHLIRNQSSCAVSNCTLSGFI